ncbi:MAG: hemerythrin domain-containing protein [Candidatus Dormiibacterota bacterium]
MTATPSTRHSDTSDMRFPHGLFRTVFSEAPGLIDATAPGDRERTSHLGSLYENVLAFLRAHHGAEDELLWPLPRERAPEQKALLDRMENQHQAVDEVTAATEKSIAAYKDAPSSARAQELAASLRRLGAELDAHLVEEGQEILPLAAVTVSQEEWGQMPGWVVQHFPGDKFWLIAGLLFEQMTPDEVELTLAHQPPALQQMWRDAGKRDCRQFMTALRSRSG